MDKRAPLLSRCVFTPMHVSVQFERFSEIMAGPKQDYSGNPRVYLTSRKSRIQAINDPNTTAKKTMSVPIFAIYFPIRLLLFDYSLFDYAKSPVHQQICSSSFARVVRLVRFCFRSNFRGSRSAFRVTRAFASTHSPDRYADRERKKNPLPLLSRLSSEI